MNYLLAIDEGTSSTRAMLFSTKGQLIHQLQSPLTPYYPSLGHVEQDPEEIWNHTIDILKQCAADINPKKIVALGMTNQRETTVVWHKGTGQCIYPAIVWQDRRTQVFCDGLDDKKELIQQKTGLRPDPYFSASKIKWILDNVKDAQLLADKGELAFGTIDSFLIWRLTHGRVHATDVTNASRTMLYNIFDNEWDQELLELFGIPQSMLPDVYDSDAHFGNISAEFIGAEVPIIGVAGDQQAALIGQHCLLPGMLKATYGTGGFLLKNTGSNPIISNHGLLTTIAYKVKGETIYGLEGSIYQAGNVIKWLRDGLSIIKKASETDALASQTKTNGGVYLIPSFTGLGAPYWSSSEGAVITGIRQDTKPAHFARAALECVSYQSRDVIASMVEDSQIEITNLKVDGGMTDNTWLLNHLSFQLGMPISKPSLNELTCFGAMMLAAVGSQTVGSLESFEDIFQYQKIQSDSNEQRRQFEYEGWQSAIKKVIG